MAQTNLFTDPVDASGRVIPQPDSLPYWLNPNYTGSLKGIAPGGAGGGGWGMSGSPIMPQGGPAAAPSMSGSPIAPQGGVLAPNPYGGASMLNTIMGPATAPLYGGGSMLNTIMGPATQPLYGGGFAAPGTGANPYAGKSYPAAAAAGNPYAQGGGGTAGGSSVGQNLQNNIAAGPSLQSIMSIINGINLSAQQQANAGRIPGDTGLEQQSSANIGSALGGQLPQDVTNFLSQQAAERGTAMGSAGSPNANASLLRSLGLTSLGLQGTGQQWLSAANARNPVAPIGDPMQQLLNPYQAGLLGIDQARLGMDWYRLLNPQSGGASSSRGGGGSATDPTSASSSGYLDPRIAGQIFGTAPNPANPTSGTSTSGSYNDFGVPESDWNYLLGASDVNPYTGYNDINPFAAYDSE